MTHTTTEPDLAERLLCIWKWQAELDRATAAKDERKVARAAVWLARHKIRLAEEAGHMPVSISA